MAGSYAQLPGAGPGSGSRARGLLALRLPRRRHIIVIKALFLFALGVTSVCIYHKIDSDEDASDRRMHVVSGEVFRPRLASRSLRRMFERLGRSHAAGTFEETQAGEVSELAERARAHVDGLSDEKPRALEDLVLQAEKAHAEDDAGEADRSGRAREGGAGVLRRAGQRQDIQLELAEDVADSYSTPSGPKSVPAGSGSASPTPRPNLKLLTPPQRSAPEEGAQRLASVVRKEDWEQRHRRNSALALRLTELNQGKLSQAAALRSRSLPLAPPRDEPSYEPVSDAEMAARREEVREAARLAWAGYVRLAWGHDELLPVSGNWSDSFGGLGATVIDSLDTLAMLGLEQEYLQGVRWVAEGGFDLGKNVTISVFETVIRVVGGFLSAYELRGDASLLDASRRLGDKLMAAYATPTGIPLNQLNLASGEVSNGRSRRAPSALAEYGTQQLELCKLSQLARNDTYCRTSLGALDYVHGHYPNLFLLPLSIDPRTGRFFGTKVSLGAMGDSYYEYLLKLWILRGRRDEALRWRWERAMDEILEHLTEKGPDGLLFLVDIQIRRTRRTMDHLACFVPGMLALGVQSGAVPGEEKQQLYTEAAEELTRTCWQMYARTRAGLPCEFVTWDAERISCSARSCLQRPEALEAMFYMWRITRDWKYRAWGWEIFKAYQEHARVPGVGYGGIVDVMADHIEVDDRQQSFFLAETIKYFWLLFSDDDALDLDAVVLNTEAHPLKIQTHDADVMPWMPGWDVVQAQ